MVEVLKNKSKVKKNGFTLIELILVVVLASVVAISVFPKYFDFKDDSHTAVIAAAVAAIKTSLVLFKSKTLTSGSGASVVVEFDGVKGSAYQPYAANYSGSMDYSSPPSIFIAAGLMVDEWSYRIFIESGTYAVVATPKSVLARHEPTQLAIKETNCYFLYHWQISGRAQITRDTTGC